MCFGGKDNKKCRVQHIKASPESQCDDLLGSSRSQILWSFKLDIFSTKKTDPEAKRLDIYTSCGQRPNNLVQHAIMA